MQSIIAHLDDIKIGQVITNLIGNALKFTQSGGYITVTVSHLKDKGSVMISVADTGVGIAPVSVSLSHFVHLFYACMAGKYWQTFSRCHAVLARYSSAGWGSWLGTIQ